MKRSPGDEFKHAALEQFALPFAREERIFLVKMLFATRQNLQTNSKDALVKQVRLRVPLLACPAVSIDV